MATDKDVFGRKVWGPDDFAAIRSGSFGRASTDAARYSREDTLVIYDEPATNHSFLYRLVVKVLALWYVVRG